MLVTYGLAVLVLSLTVVCALCSTHTDQQAETPKHRPLCGKCWTECDALYRFQEVHGPGSMTIHTMCDDCVWKFPGDVRSLRKVVA